mgnify:CR=1 FL=1
MKRITDNCTGCRACEQLCPKHCIAMRPDKEGFATACVDEEKCVDCGLCRKSCPQNRTDLLNQTAHRTIAVRLKDEGTLHKSASGGAFAGLAAAVINQGGVVFGVRYNEDLKAIHAKAESQEELYPLLSSKYVQSDTGSAYQEVKDYLMTGRLVLFSGTGCQVAGLKSYLKVDYDNLILIDLVCHGVTSPLLFQKYIEMLSKKHGAKIEEYDFRDKSGGWGLGYKYKYKYKYGLCTLDPYYKYFLDGTAYRECCYSCKYAKTERCGDITIADYWGIEKFHPSFYSYKGVSLVLLNTEKGNLFWEKSSNCFEWIESKLEYAVVENGNLQKPTRRKAEVRDHIYDEINTLPAAGYFKKCMPVCPSMADCVKSFMPMRLKLTIKRIIWIIKKYSRK